MARLEIVFMISIILSLSALSLSVYDLTHLPATNMNASTTTGDYFLQVENVSITPYYVGVTIENNGTVPNTELLLGLLSARGDQRTFQQWIPRNENSWTRQPYSHVYFPFGSEDMTSWANQSRVYASIQLNPENGSSILDHYTIDYPYTQIIVYVP